MSGSSKSGTALSWYPVAGCPAISTPSERNCCTRRQISERLVPISSAILVPLATTVAFSINNRTTRPRRKSVRCGAGSFGRGRLTREAVLDRRFVSSFVMEGIMRESRRKNKCQRSPDLAKSQKLRARSVLHRRHTQTHVGRERRMGQCADGNEIHSSLGIRPHIFQRDPSGTFDWNTPLGPGTALDCGSHLFDWHIVKQDSFCAVGERFFQLCQASDFNLDRLRSTPVSMRSFESRRDASCQR